MELDEYEWAKEQENFVKFGGAGDRKHGPILDNSGASMLHITGMKGVFFYECIDIDGAFGLLMQLVSMLVNKVLQSFIGTFTFTGLK